MTILLQWKSAVLFLVIKMKYYCNKLHPSGKSTFGKRMNLKLVVAACLLSSLALTACSKQESAPAAQQSAASEATGTESATVSPEQQAAIDALDKPAQDEKNTDVAESVANAPADQATIPTETEASAAH